MIIVIIMVIIIGQRLGEPHGEVGARAGAAPNNNTTYYVLTSTSTSTITIAITT